MACGDYPVTNPAISYWTAPSLTIQPIQADWVEERRADQWSPRPAGVITDLAVVSGTLTTGPEPVELPRAAFAPTATWALAYLALAGTLLAVGSLY